MSRIWLPKLSIGEETKSYNVNQSKTSDDKSDERGFWTGRLDFILSCLGTAVGLGNIWRFPYLCYTNGGGAFLIPYVIMVFVVGIPIFLVELTLGQYSALDPVKLFHNLSPMFKGLGYAMVISAASVTLYYNMVIAWTLFYLFDSFRVVLRWQFCNNWFNTMNCFSETDYTNCKADNSTNVFFNRTCFNSTFAEWNGITDIPVSDRVAPPAEYLNNYVLRKSSGIDEMGNIEWKPALCLLLAWAIVTLSLIKGIKSSGKVVYFTAVFPYVVLLIFFIKGLTLDGSANGLKYYLEPNFTKLGDIEVWQKAAIQVFYSFSVGGGGMITYASYNKFTNNLLKDAIIIGIADTLSSLFSGLVVFTMLGFMAKQLGKGIGDVVTEGTALVFVAYPEGISRMSASPFWAVLFFFMLILLGVDSQFAMVETIITPIFDNFPKSRKIKPVVVTTVGIMLFLLGLPMAARGGIYVFDLMDEYVAGWPYLFVGLAECLVVAYAYGIKKFLSDIKLMTNWKPNFFVQNVTAVAVGFLAPIVLTVILIVGWVQYKSFKTDTYTYPTWANNIGIILAVIPILCVPVGMIHEIFRRPLKRPFLQHARAWISSTDEWNANAKQNALSDSEIEAPQKQAKFQKNTVL